MSRQLGVFAGIGAVVALVGGALFMVLSEPSDPDVVTDTGTSKVEGQAPEPAPEEKDTNTGRRRARVPGGAALFGIVQHAADEKPAAAQAVRLVGDAIGTVEATTDSAGAFRFEQLPPGGPFAVEVDAAGFAPIRLPGIALDRSEERDLGTLVLDLAVRVEIHVHDMGDEPIAGARVGAYAAPEFGWGFDWSKAMAQMGQEPVAVAFADAGADGVVVFDELAAGGWTFVARKDGYAATGKASIKLRSSETPDPVVLHLATGHTLTGRVLDENDEPLAGALVMAGGGNMWNLGAAPLRARATSGSDGRYELAALPAGDTPIFASPAGATPGQVITLRIPDVSTFDIKLRAGGVVTGIVTMKESGEPVEGAKVRAMTWGGSGARNSEAVTDAEGRYTIDDLPEGNLGNVSVEKDGLMQVVDTQAQFQATPFRSGERVERDMQLAPAAAVSGTVTGPNGPVSGARVMVMYQRAAGNFDQKQATTDSEGHYRVNSLGEGRFLVQAGAPGLYTPEFPANWWMALQGGNLPEHLTGEAVAGEEIERDLELRAGTTISGKVETSDGDPVAGASVTATSNNGWLGGSSDPAISAEDGSFVVEGVIPGPQVQLAATRKGLALTQRDPLAMDDGEPIENEVIVMQSLPIVRGRVTTSTGELPVDAYVQVIAMPENSGNRGWSPNMFAGNAERHPVRRDGSFEVTIGWAQGAFNVLASAPGFPAKTSERMKLEEGRTEYEVDVQLGDGLSLAGNVVSDVTGDGIEGAHVRVSSTSRSTMDSMEMDMVVMEGMAMSGRTGGGGGGVVVAITDESGAFRVSGLVAGDHKVSASAEGFVAGTADARTPGGAQVSVKLAPELEITGVVAFGNGEVVSGVTVTATSADSAGSGPRGPSGFPGMGGGGGGGASGTTDGSGHFVLRGLARGQYILSVQNGWGGTANVQPFKSQPTPAGTADVTLTVQKGLRIAGRIVNESGEPVTQCWIWANSVSEQGQQTVSVNARSKPDGTFELVGLSNDIAAYNVTFNAQRMGGSYSPVTMQSVKAGATGIEVVMKTGLKIEGTIVDEDGKPLTNAWIMAQPVREDGDTTPRNSGNGMVDPKGAFVVTGLQPGRYALTAQSFGAGGNKQLVLEGGESIAAGTSELRLTASSGAMITGTVVDTSGQGVPNTTVMASPTAGGRGASGRTDENGEFEVSGLKDGAAYNLTARAGGKISTQANDVAAGSNGVRIEVREGVTVEGTALAADGSALNRVRLYLRPVEGGNGQNARCDEAGRFVATGLEEGKAYKVTARIRKDGAFKSLDLGQVTGGQTGVELRAAE